MALQPARLWKKVGKRRRCSSENSHTRKQESGHLTPKRGCRVRTERSWCLCGGSDGFCYQYRSKAQGMQGPQIKFCFSEIIFPYLQVSQICWALQKIQVLSSILFIYSFQILRFCLLGSLFSVWEAIKLLYLLSFFFFTFSVFHILVTVKTGN